MMDSKSEINKSAIMVVDDDPSLREVLGGRLSAEGFIVKVVDSGYEALRQLKDFKPQLFILDITMPGMNGIELLERLNVPNNSYEAIMVTALSELSLAKKAMEQGAYSYVTKPFDFDDLMRHVVKALELAVLKEEKAGYLHSLEEQVNDRTRELKDTLEIMENREERLDAVVTSIDEGLMAIDNEDNIMLMNSRAEKLLGVNFAATMGSPIETALKQPDLREQLLPLLRGHGAVCKEGNIVTIHSKDIGERHCAVRISPIRNRKGKQIGTIVIFIDQTEKTMAERMRSSFLSVVSHELRTPVNILTNYFSILKTDTAVEGLIRESLRDMERTGERLKQLVNNLIHVASLSGSVVDMQTATIDIGSLIGGVVEKFDAQAGEQGISFDVDCVPDAILAETDPRILSIALDALVSNAVKYNRKKGRVEIRASLENMETEQRIVISITDEGPGIAQSELQTLSSGFIQGEEPLTRRHGGTGTGLFLAKRATEILGGTITVEPGKGGGTTFRLALPVHTKKR